MTFSAIQIILILIALFGIVRVFVKVRSRSIPTIWASIWALVWIGLAAVALLPQTTDLLAASVGIGRGADLIVYLAVVVLFFVTFKLIVKIESLEQQITKLVRAGAIKDMGKNTEFRKQNAE